MATTTISALTAASGIDGTNDYLPIDRASTSSTQRINRSTFLGFTGTPADISTAQVFTNKTIAGTNVITQRDGSFTLQNTADNTKQGVFSLAGLTTATTRTWTMPNASVTLASLSGIETLTNKTITAPVITGGSIDNSTITVDSIAGHTSSTIVSIAGLQISGGVLSTANAVTATSIADSAVQPKALTTGTGSGWAWQNWTPTWTNLTPGNGTVTAKYIQTGKTVTARLSVEFGNTSAISGAVQFTLPVTAVAYAGAGSSIFPLGVVEYQDTGVARYVGEITMVDATHALLQVSSAAGTYVGGTGLSSLIPFTWGNSDGLFTTFTFEAA